MQAIEFTYDSDDGMIRIPDKYRNWFKKSFKVILLASESTQTTLPTDDEVRSFFERFQLDLSTYHFNRDEANER